MRENRNYYNASPSFAFPTVKRVNKDRFEEAIHQEIEQWIQLENNHPNHEEEDKLTPKKLKQQKLTYDLINEFQAPELENYLKKAKITIFTDARRYLPPEEYAALNANFVVINEKLASIELKNLQNQPFYEILNISMRTREALLSLGIINFDKKQYENALALFVLLTTLDPMQPDYWLRLAITAQYDEKFELAIKAYSITLFLDPDSLSARLFACQCYLKIKSVNEAYHEWIEAQKLLQINKEEIDEIWHQLSSNLEKVLKLSKS